MISDIVDWLFENDFFIFMQDTLVWLKEEVVPQLTGGESMEITTTDDIMNIDINEYLSDPFEEPIIILVMLLLIFFFVISIPCVFCAKKEGIKCAPKVLVYLISAVFAITSFLASWMLDVSLANVFEGIDASRSHLAFITTSWRQYPMYVMNLGPFTATDFDPYFSESMKSDPVYSFDFERDIPYLGIVFYLPFMLCLFIIISQLLNLMVVSTACTKCNQVFFIILSVVGAFISQNAIPYCVDVETALSGLNIHKESAGFYAKNCEIPPESSWNQTIDYFYDGQVADPAFVDYFSNGTVTDSDGNTCMGIFDEEMTDVQAQAHIDSTDCGITMCDSLHFAKRASGAQSSPHDCDDEAVMLWNLNSAVSCDTLHENEMPISDELTAFYSHMCDRVAPLSFFMMFICVVLSICVDFFYCIHCCCVIKQPEDDEEFAAGTNL